MQVCRKIYGGEVYTSIFLSVINKMLDGVWRGVQVTPLPALHPQGRKAVNRASQPTPSSLSTNMVSPSSPTRSPKKAVKGGLGKGSPAGTCCTICTEQRETRFPMRLSRRRRLIVERGSFGAMPVDNQTWDSANRRASHAPRTYFLHILAYLPHIFMSD